MLQAKLKGGKILGSMSQNKWQNTMPWVCPETGQRKHRICSVALVVASGQNIYITYLYLSTYIHCIHACIMHILLLHAYSSHYVYIALSLDIRYGMEKRCNLMSSSFGLLLFDWKLPLLGPHPGLLLLLPAHQCAACLINAPEQHTFSKPLECKSIHRERTSMQMYSEAQLAKMRGKALQGIYWWFPLLSEHDDPFQDDTE